MKLFRTKIWSWWDIGVLKWYCILVGMIAGAFFHELVMRYVWVVLILAVIFAIRSVIVYFRD
jgi:hypothetical protein